MKKLILLLFFFQGIQAQELNIIAGIDPTASLKEKALDIIFEVEYSGKYYAKLGVEQLALDINYFDIHAGVGKNIKVLNTPKIRTYAGIRGGIIYRGKDSKSTLLGVETGIDYKILPNLFGGLRATLDSRLEGRNLGWSDYTRASGYIRIGYQINLKKDNDKRKN